MTKSINPIIFIIFRIVVIAIFFWIIVSYIEVVTHNLDATSYNYSNWNCFVIFLNKFSPIHWKNLTF